MRTIALSLILAVIVPVVPGAAIAAVPEDAALAGRVWRDVDVNGLRDRGEEGAPGIVVLLLGRADDQADPVELGQTTTDENGGYAFADVAVGEAQVQFRLPDQLAFTYRDVGDDDARDSDADRTTGRTDPVPIAGGQPVRLDAGVLLVPELRVIGGIAWEDTDGNDVWDDFVEPPLSGVTVRLLRESRAERRRRGGRRLGGGRVTLDEVASVATDGIGEYTFYVLPGDDVYRVEVVPPDDYEIAQRDQGLDDLDSDVDPSSGRSDLLDALADRFVDVGLAPMTGIADWAWVDDGDGLQGPDEEGLPDVLVVLYEVDDDGDLVIVDGTITDDEGFYAFDGLRPGVYRLRFLPPEDYGYTLFQAGDDRALDSDASPDGGLTPEIVLPDDAVPPFIVARPILIAERGGILSSHGRALPGGRPVLPGWSIAGGGRLVLGAAAVDDDAIPGGGAKPAGLGPWFAPEWDAGFIRNEGRIPYYGFDVEGGALICGGTRRVNDPEVTIERVRSWRLPDGAYVFLVRMARGLKKDYSFAVVLYIRTPIGVLSFVWEIHDERSKVGQMDPETGDLVQEADGNLRIFHARDMGLVGFELPPGSVPDDADLALFRAFHTPEAGQSTRCHQTPTFDVPR